MYVDRGQIWAALNSSDFSFYDMIGGFGLIGIYTIQQILVKLVSHNIW
jgi:hypothetical protein